MKTSSAKAKGRRAAVEICDQIYKHFPTLEPGDLYATPSGVNGEDVVRSAKAKRVFPFTIESKNQEKLQIWEALEQAKSHLPKGDLSGQTPALVFRRNRSELHICLRFEDFLKIYATLHALKGESNGETK